jgi:hypothetical protein
MLMKAHTLSRWEELELVLEVLRREQGAVGEPPDVLHPVDDLHVAVGIEEPGVAGVEPALGILDLARRLGVLVVLAKQAVGADEELALRAEAQLDAGHRRADRV